MAKKNVDGLEKQLFSDRERMEIWIAENWKKCLVLAAAVVVAVVAVSAVFHFRQKSDSDYRAKLASAGIENLAGVIAENAEHPAVPAARTRLAKMFFAKGDFRQAGEEFNKVAAAKNCSAYLRENALMDSALCAELAGDFKSAAAAYSAIEADTTVSAGVRAEAGFNAGRILLKSGDLKGAQAAFSKVAAMSVPGAVQASDLWVSLSKSTLAAIKNGDFTSGGKAAPAVKKAGK